MSFPGEAAKIRVRHDDPRIGPYTPAGTRVHSAVELASDVEGLRLVLAAAAPVSAAVSAPRHGHETSTRPWLDCGVLTINGFGRPEHA